MADEPVFIVAGSLQLARSTAMDLGLHQGQWRWLDRDYELRGRRSVRICYGYGWSDLLHAREIEHVVSVIERRRPGSVEIVQIPEREA